MTQRDFRIDNIKWLLILLVVFGHLVEQVDGAPAAFLYTVVYVFHMPAFVFITGYFAKFKPRRIGALALAYVVFQTLYCLADWALAGPGGTLSLQYFTPNWIMWYLLATIVWLLALPLFRTQNRTRMGITLAVSAAVAIAVGFCDGIGYFLSLSRILVLLPFFLAGFYARQLVKARDTASGGGDTADDSHRWPLERRVLLGIGIAGAAITVVVVALCDVNYVALYNSHPYARTHTGPGFRLGMLALAACWICLLFAAMPNKRIPAVTNAGACSMAVYLLHGFVVRAMRTYVDLPFGDVGNVIFAAALAVVLVFAFGNRFLDKLVRFGL